MSDKTLNHEIAQAKTPKQIVKELEAHIVGHKQALATMGNAMRYRWRRRMLEGELRNEVIPKNILMIGNTGIGKTEIARRIAILEAAPFLKVEATKFTEVGYVGRDVESIVRDLIEVAYIEEKERHLEKVQSRVDKIALHKLSELYIRNTHSEEALKELPKAKRRELQKETMKKLAAHELDSEFIEMASEHSNVGIEILTTDGGSEFTESLQNILDNVSSDKKKNLVSIPDAYTAIREEEISLQTNEKELRARALSAAEDYGIVFIDEIDKLISKGGSSQTDVSRDGVQRDLLSIIEGTTISTKYGTMKTDHILFIAAGAFIGVQPSDLISELQGRLPVKVKLSELTVKDFADILSKPRFNLIRQYQALLACDHIELTFSDEAVYKIAEYAFNLNKTSENIGARRLHAVLETLLEEISFNAPPARNQTKVVEIDGNFVDKKLGQEANLSRLDESIM